MIDANAHFGPRLNPEPDAPLEEVVGQARTALRPWVQEMVRITPREQILYGTDVPLLNPAHINGT